MSFVKNDTQQMTMDGSYFSLTKREVNMLNHSWAAYFSDHIFPKIDEEHFSVLYSKNTATRPATPVNVVFGALLLKEMFGQTDDEIVESLVFDIRYQYALHTTSMKEQPLSDRTLGRFRARCLEYESNNNRDLIKEEIVSLSEEMAHMMNIDGKKLRMDSMMIASNIRRMGRLELLYTCLSNMVKELKNNNAEISDELVHYTEDDDRNKVIYHSKSEELSERIATVLKDSKTVLGLCGCSYENSSAYILLNRVLSEQTVTEKDGTYRLRTKDDGGMNSEILQNPSDPDATYREKAGTENIGYSANLLEAVDGKNSIVTGYDFDKNTHSDSSFGKEVITQLGKQEEEVTLVADGAFSSKENVELAESNNINLVTTNMTGKPTEEICADFKFSDDGKKVIECPCGKTPKSCSYNKTSGQCVISFDRSVCEACPFFDKCKPHVHKRTCRKSISSASKRRAEQKRYMKTDEFKKLCRFRNGIETVPSYLRRAYNVDKMPVRGKYRCKLYFGMKIGASNIKKFCKYMRNLLVCGLKPSVA